MKILGIETSCDETAAALVQNGRYILASVVSSSLKEHAPYGGIIPEIASRRQLELINDVVKKTLIRAGQTLKAVDAVAATVKPGLIGSLLVGTSFAKALSYAIKKPFIPTDHIRAHLYANFLSKKNERRPLPRLPAIGCIISGGHTSLFFMKNFTSFRLLGQTRDDAAGEAFDKVARLLHLGYPGGPVIDRLAKEGENSDIAFPRANLPGTSDFSFSGIKTAVLHYVKRYHPKKEEIKKIAYAFQYSVVRSLTEKCVALCLKTRLKSLLIGGGVAANSLLRETLRAECAEKGIRLFIPALNLCMDNAAMVAGLAFHHIKKQNVGKPERKRDA